MAMALLTSTIGSFPEPQALHEARRRFSEGEIDSTALRRFEDEAMRQVVALQDTLGIHLVVDGEMDRADPIATFAERLSGVETNGWVRIYGDQYARRPKITGPLARTSSLTAERWRLARDAARGAVKAVLPGPYSLMDGSFDEHYGSRRDVCLAFAEIVRDEAAELAAAGAAEIQLDEPAAGARPAEIPLLREALSRVMEPLRGRSRLWVYLGYADLEAQGAELAAIPANGLLVAGAHCGYEGLARFARALPDDAVVGVGVIDVLDPRPEGEAEVRERIAHVRRIVQGDRLWAVPDGGFRALSQESAQAKLAALAAASDRP
jgi:5-methyltetrahydropteroyltriglutamate--homocysteine methyltransferase